MGSSHKPHIRLSNACRGDDDHFIWIFHVDIPQTPRESLSVSARGADGSNLDGDIRTRGIWEHDDIVSFELSVDVPGTIRRFSLSLVSEASHKTLAHYTVGPVERHLRKVDYSARIRNAVADGRYGEWFEEHRTKVVDSPSSPGQETCSMTLFSIVTPVFNTPEVFLRAMLDSVEAQLYPNWEHILVNASPDDKRVGAVLAEYSLRDPRFRIVELEKNLGIAENTNRGIEQAKGDFVCFLDHDDLLEPDVLREYSSAIEQHDNVDLLYCDEDSVDENGQNHNSPLFKPDRNLDLLYSNDYVIHFLAVSRYLLERTERSTSRYDGAQDYDLTLQAFEKGRRIKHVARILYHWRQHIASMSLNPDDKPYAQEAGRLAIADSIDRRGLRCRVDFGDAVSTYRTDFLLPEPEPLIAMIVPVMKDPPFDLSVAGHRSTVPVAERVTRLLQSTDYKRLELIFICADDASEEADSIESLTDGDTRIHLIRGSTSSWISLANEGRKAAQSGLLLFGESDLLPRDGTWLATMAGYFERSEVSAVSPRLVQPDGLLVGMGLTIRPDGHLGYLNHDLPLWDGGYVGCAHRPRDVSAASAACLMVRAEDFDRAGGFRADFESVSNNDYAAADLCMSLQSAGGLIVYTPYALLGHARPSSLDDDTMKSADQRGASLLTERWGDQLVKGDPNLNPNFDPYGDYFLLRKR